MTLAEVIPAAKKLSSPEKLKLIRILIEELDTNEDILSSELSQQQNLPNSTTHIQKQLRPFGLCAGEFVVPENFDEPLPEDMLSAFEGK
jgi:hypothetical protein